MELVAQILDDASSTELLSANPARGKRRRLKVPKSPRTFLEPDMLNGTAARNGDAAIKGVVDRANEERAAPSKMLLPASVTPHTLRRTFASLGFFAGRDLRWVMGRLGHDDARMTLAVYAQCMKRKRIDQALVWTLMRFPDEPAGPLGAMRRQERRLRAEQGSTSSLPWQSGDARRCPVQSHNARIGRARRARNRWHRSARSASSGTAWVP